MIKGAADGAAKEAVPSAVAAAVSGANAADIGVSATIKEEPVEETISNQRRTTEKSPKRSNPHKYLLYRPTLSQLMVYLATAFKVHLDYLIAC